MLIKHNLRIVKLLRGKQYVVIQMIAGFKFTFFANFKSSIKSSSPWESSKIACKKKTGPLNSSFMRPNSNSTASRTQNSKNLVEEIMEMKLFCNLWSGKQMCTIMIIFNVTK